MRSRAALGRVKRGVQRRAQATVPVRDPLRGSDPVALYARFLDGEHLWLAVHRARSLALRLPDGTLHALDGEPGHDGDVEVLSLRADVAGLLADSDDPEVDLPLLEVGSDPRPVRHAATRRKGPALPAPTTRDRRWQLTVAAVDGQVVVRRRPVAPAVEVLGFAADADAVIVRVPVASGTATLVDDEQVVLAELPVVDGVLRLTDDVTPAPGATLRVLVDGVPAVRRRNYLGNPQQAVLLPALPGGAELRWTAGGRLGLHTRSAGESA